MHRCWLISELAAKIAEACYPDYRNATFTTYDKAELGTLCALARTCRALQNAALDVIWYYQPGLHHVLRCMLDDLWSTRVVLADAAVALNSPSYTRVARRTVVGSDWSRFDLYASRVRKLHCHAYHSRGQMEPTSKEYEALCEMKGRPLLPCLQSVVFCPSLQSSPDEPFHLLNCLITETVTSLNVRCSRIEDGRRLFVSLISLMSYVPTVQKLHIELPPAALDIHTLITVLRTYHTLRSFSLTVRAPHHGLRPAYTMDSYLLSQLASLPKLVSLELTSEVAYTRHTTDTPGSLLRLPYTDTLLLDTIDVKSASRILHDLSLPSASTLTLSTTTAHPTPSAIVALLPALKASVSTHTLRSLSLHIAATRADRTSAPIPAAALAPLLSFPRLHTLSLRLGFRVALTDADLETFAGAWPLLRSLEIVGKRSAKNNFAPTLVPALVSASNSASATAPSRPTFRGLAYLVRGCPDLQTITLALSDPSPLPLPPLTAHDDTTTLPTSPHPVVLAFTHAWTPSSPLHTARWLARMFPRLVDVNGVRSSSVDGGGGGGYDGTEGILRMHEYCCQDMAWREVWREVVRLVEVEVGTEGVCKGGALLLHDELFG